jgi:hypothetical protein
MAALRPAATVVNAGAENREMLGDWKFMNIVLRTMERSGDARFEGRARTTLRGLESISRYL